MKARSSNNELNTELFENALYLVNVRIRKCMIPRNEIEAVDITTRSCGRSATIY